MLRRQYLYGVAALLVLPVAAANADEQTWFPSEPPSSANPGECYARVRIEPQYEPFTESVVTGDSYESYDVRPPVLDQTVTEYMSREAGMRYVVREPIYETVVERVQVRPAYVEYVVEPAVHAMSSSARPASAKLKCRRNTPTFPAKFSFRKPVSSRSRFRPNTTPTARSF